MRKRRLVELISLCVLTILLVSRSAPASMQVTAEQMTDRPGSDYRGYELETPDPSLCRAACESDRKCQAYTWVRPGVQGEKSVCYLKNSIPPAHTDGCCVSGIRMESRRPLQSSEGQRINKNGTTRTQQRMLSSQEASQDEPKAKTKEESQLPSSQERRKDRKKREMRGQSQIVVQQDPGPNMSQALCTSNPIVCCPAKQVATEGCEAVTKALLDVRIRSYVPPRFTVMGRNYPWDTDFHLDNIVSDVTVNGPFKVWPGCRFNVAVANNAIEDSKSVLQKGMELAEAWLHQWSSGVESAKSYVANGVADKVCGAVDDSDSCRSKVAGVVKTGINVGLSSLGIPPELPDIQQLRANGVEYLASQAASYAIGELDFIGKLPADNELLQELYDEAYDKAVDEFGKQLNKVIPPANFNAQKPQTWGHLEPAYAPHNAHLYVEVQIRPGMYRTYLKFITAKPSHEWPPLYLHDLNGIFGSRGPVEIPRLIPSSGLIMPFTLLPKEVAYTAADTAPAQIPGVKVSLEWLKNDFGLTAAGLVKSQLNWLPRKGSIWHHYSDWDLGYADGNSAKFRLLSPIAGHVLDWEDGWKVSVGQPLDDDVPRPEPASKAYKVKLYDYYGRIDPAPRCSGKPNVVAAD